MSSSSEVGAALMQAEKRFAAAIYETGLGGTQVQDIDYVKIFICLLHPYFHRDGTPRGRVSRSYRTIYVDTYVDYISFSDGGWDGRISAIALAALAAVARLPKSRVDEAARRHFTALIEAAAAIAKQDPPSQLVEIGPFYVKLDADGFIESAGSTGGDGHRQVALHEIHLYRRRPVQEDTAPASFTLYRNAKGEAPRYVSAWFHEGWFHIHRGVCGTRGELNRRAVATIAEARPLLSDVRREAVAEGYKAIGFSGMTHMAASYPAETETGPPMSTQDRHQLEDQWTNLLGWYGLGNCDGGESGMGAHDVHFYVVNAKLAMATINSEPEFQALKGAAHVFVVKD